MPKFLMMGIALFLVLAAAGYGLTTIQARSVPWDCADWQAFAHDDRTTAILESLAENRGKTLYCGVDQSDTFTKAETWEAGRDRNERDDTVYFGERGQFRGFIAAQEGYLTDGESGVTGVSIDRIFEFPREERRRTKRVKRLHIASGNDCPDTHQHQLVDYTAGTLACSEWGPAGSNNWPPTTMLGPIGKASISWSNGSDRITKTGRTVMHGRYPGRLSPRRPTGRSWPKPKPKALAGLKAIRRSATWFSPPATAGTKGPTIMTGIAAPAWAGISTT